MNPDHNQRDHNQPDHNQPDNGRPEHVTSESEDVERHDLVDGLEAFVLDQLDDTSTEAYERSLRSHPDLAVAADELREALAGLADTEPAFAPPSLRGDVLTAATRRRRPGIDDGLPAGADAPRCHRATVGLVSAVIDDLDDADMHISTIYGIPVIELIRHLNGVEKQLARALAGRTSPPPDGFSAAGHRGVRDGTDADDARSVVAAWHVHSDALAAVLTDTALLADDAAYDVAGLSMSAERLIVVRAFEQWSHAEDISRALGRPTLVPPADVLHTMATHAVDLLLPVVETLTPHLDTTVRITLTGPGGGSWLRRIGGSDARDGRDLDPFTTGAATVVADIVDFCRLVAARATDDMPVQRYGDTEVCDTILDLAPALADYGAGPLD